MQYDAIGSLFISMSLLDSGSVNSHDLDLYLFS